MPTNHHPQAISYVRFSAIHQGQGSSVDRQKQLTSEWLQRHPEYKLSKLSQQDLGKSGYKGTHLEHGLGIILDAINDGKIKAGDALLIEAFDRLGRLEPLEMVSLVTSIVTKGIDIYTLQDQAKYDLERLNENSGALFILVGKVQAAHDYSRQLSKRISASYENRRRLARSGAEIKAPRPMWLDKDNKLNQRAEGVKACIDLYKQDYGAKTILNKLVGDFPFLESVAPSTLNRWFKNPALYGAWRNDREPDQKKNGLEPSPIDGVFEPLITKEEFYTLKQIMKARTFKPSAKHTYHLSGIIKCVCGARYHTRRQRYKDDTILYCNCKNYLDKGYRVCGNKQTWPYEVLDHIYEMSNYWDVLTNHAMERGELKTSEKLVVLDAKIEENNKKMENVATAIENMGGSELLYNRLINMERTKAELEQERLALTNDFELSDDLINAMNITLNDLHDDPDAIRKVLIIRGFQLTIDMNSVEIPYMTTKLKITLKRNLQKYRVYLLELSHPEYEILNADEDEPPIVYPADTWYQGFSRKDGVVAESESYQELVKQLEARKQEMKRAEPK